MDGSDLEQDQSKVLYAPDQSQQDGLVDQTSSHVSEFADNSKLDVFELELNQLARSASDRDLVNACSVSHTTPTCPLGARIACCHCPSSTGEPDHPGITPQGVNFGQLPVSLPRARERRRFVRRGLGAGGQDGCQAPPRRGEER